MRRSAYIYIYGVIAVGIVVIIASIATLVLEPISMQWLVLAGLTLLTGSFSVKVPSVAARFSVSEAFVFAAVLLFGPAAATVIVALDSFIMSLWSKPHRRVRSAFNFAAVALSIWLASTTFFYLTHTTPGRVVELLPIEKHFWQLFVLAALYFLFNSWFVALAVSYEKGVRVVALWLDHFPWFSLNYFGGVSVAALLVSYTQSVDLKAIAIILPLLLISYLSHRTSLGRVEDAKKHIDRVNDLYMSTIEALAMAVDAKDQITHGHIRRVQVYAVELARRVGVSDEQHVRAIEAAALLHDMGKLAIPEHILNKPGHLTEAEFEKMKRHADIGADLLSSIRFPYPVVPMVRHHHERWDGNGYPAGISGTDIPLGARILSVVDCFDALTSDRPYRPKLGVDEAFTVLRERRGTMYDPLIVDAFIAAYAEVAPVAIRAGEQARTVVDGIALSAVDERPLRQIRANVVENAVFGECARVLPTAQSTTEALEHVANCLRQLMPSTVYCFFRYELATDVITCTASVGDPLGLLRGLTIRLGERISGWSAATRRTSVNSDASLELGQLAENFVPALKSTTATPIVKDARLLGVLTTYSPQPNAFSDSHRYTIEQVSSLVATFVITKSEGKHTLVSFPHRGH